ncbi:MAG: oligosaccharide flippase family protein [Deltaproteobacteria bacterium]|nr:oligosaccharide flippase family protein [Deltaproteobacteria bacterium]
MSSTGNLVVRGTVISLVGQLAAQIIRFGSNIVLARFLPESAFGINAMVFALTTGLWLMSDVGIGASVIRSKREDDDFINTAWTLSVARGFILFGLGTIAGPIAAWFYREPQLVWLLPLCSTMVLLLASESTAYWVQQRRMSVGRTMGIDLAAQVVALFVAIPIAIYTEHVIALALAAVMSAAVKFVLTHLILPGPRMRFRWDKLALKEIFSFGQWIFLSTLFSFLATRWDVFSLARLQGFALLGVYGLAGQITSVPNQIAIQVTNTILTPVLADAFRGSIEELRARLKEARRAYLPAAALLFVGAATTAPAFFLIAYKEGFHAAGPMAQLLMLPAWLAFLQEASSRALLAAGDGRGLALSNAVKVVGTIIATLVGFELWGFWGFVGGCGAGAVVGVVVVGWRLRDHGVTVLVGDLVATVVFFVVGGAACVVPMFLEPIVGIKSQWLTLVSCVLICGPLAVLVVERVKEARANARGTSVTLAAEMPRAGT